MAPLPGRAFARPGLCLMADSVLGFSLSQDDQNAVNILSQADFIQEMKYKSDSFTNVTPNTTYASITPQNTNWTSCYIITHTVSPGIATAIGSLPSGNGILRITPDSGNVYIPSKLQVNASSYIGSSQFVGYKVTSSNISFIGLYGANSVPIVIHATFAFFL